MAPDLDSDRQQATAYIDQVSVMPLINIAFNRTVTSTTPSEILTVALLGQKPLALFILSPVAAKTFALSLLERVKDFEDMSGYPVKTYSEMEAVSSTASR